MLAIKTCSSSKYDYTQKLLYKIWCFCDTDYNIIVHLASSKRFDESDGQFFAIIHATHKNT